MSSDYQSRVHLKYVVSGLPSYRLSGLTRCIPTHSKWSTGIMYLLYVCTKQRKRDSTRVCVSVCVREKEKERGAHRPTYRNIKRFSMLIGQTNYYRTLKLALTQIFQSVLVSFLSTLRRSHRNRSQFIKRIYTVDML